MNIIESIVPSGRLHITRYEEVGGVLVPVHEWEQKNLVTTSGKNIIGLLLGGQTTDHVSYMAFGTGSTPPTAADTSLVTEVYRAEITQTSAVANVVTFRHFLPSTEANGHTLREAALLAGEELETTLFARSLLQTPIEKTDQSAYLFTWTCTIN